MTIKYRWWCSTINVTEVERENKTSYWARGRRHSKSTWGHPRDTREEAEDDGLQEYQRKVELAKRRVLYAEDQLEKYCKKIGMQP